MSEPNFYRHYTKIIIESEHGIFSAQVEEVEMSMDQLIDKVLVPALQAAGYLDEVINRHIQGAALL